MFLGAVARPNPTHNFDGRIGLYPITDQVPAQRKSKHHNKGDQVWKLVNMDANLFKRYMMERVVDDVLRLTGMWAKHIVIQMDNAGGHGGGRGDMNQTTIAELNDWAEVLPEEYSAYWPDSAQQPEIVFVAQPPRSPDTNVLDLGIWNSLQIAVDKEKQRKGLRGLTVDDIITCCEDAWSNSWDATVLEKFFRPSSKCSN